MPRPKGSKNKGKQKVTMAEDAGAGSDTAPSDAEIASNNPTPSSSSPADPPVVAEPQPLLDGKPVEPFDTDGNILDKSLAQVDPGSASPRNPTPEPQEVHHPPPQEYRQETAKDAVNRLKQSIARNEQAQNARAPPAFLRAQRPDTPPPLQPQPEMHADYTSDGGKKRGRPKKDAAPESEQAKKERDEREKHWALKQQLFIKMLKYRKLLGPLDPFPGMVFSMSLSEEDMRTILAQYKSIRNQHNMEGKILDLVCNMTKNAEPYISYLANGDYFGISESMRNDPEVLEVITEYSIEYGIEMNLHWRTLMLVIKLMHEQKLKNALKKGREQVPPQYKSSWQDI